MEELGFLLICVDMVSPVLGEVVEQSALVVHGVVPLL
jgi:hypothetical protein